MKFPTGFPSKLPPSAPARGDYPSVQSRDYSLPEGVDLTPAAPRPPLYAVVAVEFSDGARRHIAVPCGGPDQRIESLTVIAYGTEE